MTTRRDVLRAGLGIAGTAVVGSCAGDAMGRCSAASELALGSPNSTLPVDVSLALSAQADHAELLAGTSTDVWRYQAKLATGPAQTVSHLATGFRAPVLRLKRGQHVRVEFTNQLPEPTIVHWHGLDVPQASDGHPRLVIGNGRQYRYDFVVQNRAGMYWFHPHPHGRTATQVYAGLAGVVLVTDEEETKLGLPSGEYELPLVVQDRAFDAQGALRYAPNAMTGFLGDRVLVNGQPTPTLSVKRGTYRLRLLNGSNSRIYKLAFSDGTPLVVIGTDGGLLDAPLNKSNAVLAPAERLDLWLDLSALPDGRRLTLESQTFTLPVAGMMGGAMMGGAMMGRGAMMGGAMMGRGGSLDALPLGATFPVCTFEVVGDGQTRALPARLTSLSFPPAKEVRSVRRVQLNMARMRWMLNGNTFSMDAVADSERFLAGDVVEWEFDNVATMMAMAHPMHIHGTQFQVVKRDSSGVASSILNSLASGLVDVGWKDTVLVLPGERVRVRQRITEFPGLFLYHCHNLEHEDMGMMRNYCVEAGV